MLKKEKVNNLCRETLYVLPRPFNLMNKGIIQYKDWKAKVTKFKLEARLKL